ncbi:hypothetical protein [Paenisporosarcina sp. TG-14]|uniref:hypothetical protein n=1 Tax=Paenisporosarcina sp. TG-14 TaxID=1231057 RepID=UPI0002FB5EDE|nr:hypothetical protein [Paenisporosarcina sp. TG-14]
MKYLYPHNENGFLLPVAIVLLFIVSSVLLYFVTSYISQMNIYEMLESRYISATIKKMEN